MTKRTDGGSVIRCTRADGSVTWQKNEGRRAMFFPLHDLTHFAVESELGLREGFYGLLAAGWDITDTEGKGPRGPLPPEADVAERLVGALDTERSSGTEWTARDVVQHALAGDETHLLEPLTDEQLERVRTCVRDLFQRWLALEPGGTLELTFDRPAGQAGRS